MSAPTAHTTPEHLLSHLFPAERVQSALLPTNQWHPYPRAGDREPWEGLPATARSQAITRAEAHLGMAWPELPATLFLEFHRNGNRSRFEQRHFGRRHALLALVLGECVEGKGRFLDDVINGVWAICEESFWGVSAHNYSARPPFNGGHRREHTMPLGLPDTAYRVIDLFAAETGALLAWTGYLLGPQLSAELPVVTDRIERELRERILIPYRTNDTWWWLGKERRTNNWNPWIHSNVLAVNLLLEQDEAVRAATVSQIIAGLDAFLATYHSDGGCDEGTSYWDRAGGSLFDNLDLLYRASNGVLDAFSLPLVQEIGRYIVRMHIGGPWYVNFADGAARIAPHGDLIYRYGERTGEPLLMRQGAFIAESSPAEPASQAAASESPAVRRERLLTGLFQRSDHAFTRLLPAIFDSTPATVDAVAPLVREAWLDGIQVLTAREQTGSTEGLFLAAKGGSNAESHNHNDVGSFIVGLDGQPVLIDVGVETYARKTFSAQRYEIWTMRSSYHNLPLVNGVEQAAGAQFAARDVVCNADDASAEITMDIAAAYPPEAQVTTWRRTLRLDRDHSRATTERSGGASLAASGRNAKGGARRGGPAHITLEDTYQLDAPPQSLALHLMARDEVDARTPGLLQCAGPTRPLLIRYDPEQFVAAVERIPVEDARLAPVWGDAVYRIILSARAPQMEGRWELTMEAADAALD